jgi:hypothetical protein
MPPFRKLINVPLESKPPSSGLDQVRTLVADALRPAHFFLGQSLALDLEHTAAEEIYWEIYRGRLLDRPYTTLQHTFESWNLFLNNAGGRSGEPLLSVKLNGAGGQLYITRAVYCYAWETYDRGDNVILSRETKKWVRELVGTVSIKHLASLEEFRDEIICRVFQAVVGTSRLPLTSVESPLPQFSGGELAYFYHARAGSGQTEVGPLRSYQELIGKGLTGELAWIEKAKLLETLLHVTPPQELGKAADLLVARYIEPAALLALFRTLFNEISLSPYTDLVDKTLAFLRVLEERRYLTTSEVVDFLSYLLRQQGRHLTAYNLVTFHHRGANYPDALLLDAVMKAYLELADRDPTLFLPARGEGDQQKKAKRIRRRALRQGWLLRRRYEGHPVPDEPTSPGENARVLPAPHQRVPEEQIAYPQQRSKRLFAGDPLERYVSPMARTLLDESIRDLSNPVEMRELGLALFLDRPLDAGKDPLEPDQTLLLSYVAFSRSIAQSRLRFLAEGLGLIAEGAAHEAYCRCLDDLQVTGLSLEAVAGTPRTGSVSLVDAGKAAPDFLFLWTTSQTVQAFERQYFLGPLLERFCLQELHRNARKLIVRAKPKGGQTKGGLVIYDSQVRKRLELEFDRQGGYGSRGGIEYPLGPLRVVRVWEETPDHGPLREHDLSDESILLPPRED